MRGTTRTTPVTRRTAHRRPVQTASLRYGAVVLLVGPAGFIPGITTGYDTLQLVGHRSEAMLMGVFQISILHNLVHLFYGIAGLVLARSVSGARAHLRRGGVVCLLLWLYCGLLSGQESWADVVPVNTADDWLHFVLGMSMVGLSFPGRNTGTRNTTRPTY